MRCIAERVQQLNRRRLPFVLSASLLAVGSSPRFLRVLPVYSQPLPPTFGAQNRLAVMEMSCARAHSSWLLNNDNIAY